MPHTHPSTIRCRALLLHRLDNVVTLLDAAVPGPVQILGHPGGNCVDAIEPIVSGHKLALQSIAPGQSVVKYGVIIGLATEPISAGAWVHTHNCRSRLDERSHTLDPHSGAATDTRYE